MIDIFFHFLMSIYIIGIRKMKREKIKTIAIVLLSVIFVSHSIEKKGEVDALTEENLVMKRRVSLADSLIFDTTKRGLDLAQKLAI